MKISNSKKQLAKIISENGGWRDGAGWSSQDLNGSVTFFVDKPWLCGAVWEANSFECVSGFGYSHKLPNWHQTILSRDEYFHLYPAPDADGCNNLGSSVARNVVAVNGRINTGTFGDGRPTIEQMAADYHNAKDYADRKQQEADAAKADAEAKRAKLVAAGKALRLVLSVVGVCEPTGKFYSARLGIDAVYDDGTNDVICDECGRRWGEHYEGESYCKPRSERENA